MSPFTLEMEDGTILNAALRAESGLVAVKVGGFGLYSFKAESARQFANLVLWLLYDMPK